MFEYLMPRLLLASLPGTLLTEACRTAVARQIEYGRQLGLPWGISESALSPPSTSTATTSTRRSACRPGAQAGLEQDLVIAPYATVMATMLAPREALENFRRLIQEGAEGDYGFYEAIDYTPDRLPKGERSVVVRSYMAHHQGMSLVALANALLVDVMPRRFHAEPMVRADRVAAPGARPQRSADRRDRRTPTAQVDAVRAADGPRRTVAPMSRRLTTPATPVPRTHLFSNSAYHVMVTNAGSGYSNCRGLDVTRWREDATREAWGQFCYIRDVRSGAGLVGRISSRSAGLPRRMR